MTTVAATAPFTRVKIDIAHDQDWYDELPQLLEDDGSPIDLTGAALSLTIRPVYDHALLIRELSTSNGGVVIDDHRLGLATLRLPRTAVTQIPVGAWDQFLVLDQPGRAPRYREIWRGPLIVHPARV